MTNDSIELVLLQTAAHESIEMLHYMRPDQIPGTIGAGATAFPAVALETDQPRRRPRNWACRDSFFLNPTSSQAVDRDPDIEFSDQMTSVRVDTTTLPSIHEALSFGNCLICKRSSPCACRNDSPFGALERTKRKTLRYNGGAYS